MRAPLILVAMALVALNVPNSTADTAQQWQPALVGDWKAEAKDSWVLTLTNDGRWAQRDGARVDSWGAYRWRDKDLIELSAMENGQMGPTTLWRLALNGDSLTTWNASNNVAKWSRVKTTSRREPAQQREPVSSPTARFASVTIDSVVIAPFDSGGMKWDGGAATAEELQWASDQMRKLAAKRVDTATTIAAITMFAYKVAAGIFAPPDAKGSVRMIIDRKPQPAIPLTKRSNRYDPRWTGLEWRVDLDRKIQIRFDLDDDDPEKKHNEHIGTAVVNSADLVAAAASEKIFSINVADQANGRILAVNVFVVME